MIERDLAPRPASERRELLVLALGLVGLSGLTWWLFSGRSLPLILCALGLVALSGFLAFGRMGRDVYLLFSIAALLLGRVVSELIVACLYILAIGAFGSLLRMVGMNRLDRNFDRCRKKPSMFCDVPPLSAESFRRQS